MTCLQRLLASVLFLQIAQSVSRGVLVLSCCLSRGVNLNVVKLCVLVLHQHCDAFPYNSNGIHILSVNISMLGNALTLIVYHRQGAAPDAQVRSRVVAS